MLPVLVYSALVAVSVVVLHVIRPADALRSEHHQRLYWTGAAASIGLLAVIGMVLVE